jgi:hypothetical protein
MIISKSKPSLFEQGFDVLVTTIFR